MNQKPSQMSRDLFIDIFGSVYEYSRWIAEQVFDSGLTSLSDESSTLFAAMSEVVDQAGQDAQLELLQNHPDLAGKLAVSGKLTAASALEQAGAGLDRCTDAEFDEFTKLNNRYQQRFGFPFIVAVRGLDKESILEQFRHRVQNDWDTEFDCALSQVHRIARLRIDQIIVSTEDH